MLNKEIESSKRAEDVSVDVLELSRSREVKVEMKEDMDATENSSSFANTISVNENNSGLSDVEVESHFFGDTDLTPPFDGLGGVFPIRKKKLTAHWRAFIHPLMWRCKWTELRIKELESQASKYTRELTINNRLKHSADQTAEEQSGSKSLLFTRQSHRKRPMKRRKRKRVEDSTDIASYMSKHILFSERENKRFDPDGVPTLENLRSSDQRTAGNNEFDINDDCAFPEEDDNFLENILRKIELVHTRVQRLKGQLDSIMLKNASKFSSSENLSQLAAQTSSARSPTFSACNEETASLGDFVGEIVDFIIPDSAVSSFVEAIPIPDIIESTVGLLSSIDVTHHQAHIGDSSEKIVDNILIQNEAAEVEGSTFKKTQEAEHSGEEESNKAIPLLSEHHTETKPVANSKQPILKSCLSSDIHFPTNRRKRGERKAGSGNWSRQRPGEPDS